MTVTKLDFLYIFAAKNYRFQNHILDPVVVKIRVIVLDRSTLSKSIFRRKFQSRNIFISCDFNR
jgi:hypothetical protein